MDVLSPQFFFCKGEQIFMGVPPLMSNTAKTCFGEDLVKIRKAVAEQSHQKKKAQKSH